MKWILLAAAGLCLGWTTNDTLPCDDLAELRHAGEIQSAEELALKCVAEHPEDLGVMLELARLSFLNDEAAAAMDWVDRALDAAPEHSDAIMLRTRLLAHRGDISAAIEQFEALTAATGDSNEARRLGADLALWKGDHQHAAEEYALYLDDVPDDAEAWTNLGHARFADDDLEAARESYYEGCELGLDRACSALHNASAAPHYRTYAVARPGYSAARQFPDSQTLRLALGGNPTDQTSVEAGYNLARRELGADPTIYDMGVSLDASWNSPRGPRAGAGGALVFDADFSPPWSAYVEGGWLFDSNLDLGLRLGRLQFQNSGVSLIVPSATYYRGPWMLDGRYYLGIDDDQSVTQTGLARAHYFFGDRTSIYAGAGLGNAPDYLDPSLFAVTPALSHYTGLLGGTLQINPRHTLNLDLQYRHETLGGFRGNSSSSSDRYQALELMLGYKLYTW